MLVLSEPSAAWWSTPSEERRQYLRDFYAIPENREKKRARQRRYYRRNRERRLDGQREINYAITGDTYRHLLATQDGVCAICRQPSGSTYRNRPRQLSVDHDHSNGRIRGLLCNGCNTGLGHFQNDPLLLRAAADYLLYHAPKGCKVG